MTCKLLKEMNPAVSKENRFSVKSVPNPSDVARKSHYPVPSFTLCMSKNILVSVGRPPDDDRFLIRCYLIVADAIIA